MKYVVLVLLVATPVGLLLDYDQDGIATAREWTLGSSGINQDSDGDGLPDGWELGFGTMPGAADTDGDGLHDGDEWRLQSPAQNPDADGDGVQDGAEQAAVCLQRQDCDQDALPDGNETGGFDPLNSDSYDVGLDDGVVWLFQQEGLEASGDLDADGIPDAWETDDSLIDWGPFDPQPGRRDLLVEYLRVVGPSSGRFELDFRPSYNAVEDLFAEGDMHLQWVETVVELDDEYRPGILDDADAAYFQTILAEGVGSGNPYVTSMLMNPQQVQEDLRGNILGAAFLRSMIATVDYGAHTIITLDEKEGDGITLSGPLHVSPSIESHIIGARPQQVRQLAFASQGIVDMGVEPGGDLFLVTRSGGEDYLWSWTPEWFQRAPLITIEDAYLQLKVTDVQLATGTLASTIAHELGHTLGLCHAHDPDCFSKFSAADARDRHDSTMSYEAGPATLHFLDSEWAQMGRFLTCPPQNPLLVLALGGDVYQAKYDASFHSDFVRACHEPVVIQADLPNTPLQDKPAGAIWVAAYALVVTAILAVTLARTIRQRQLYSQQ